MKALTNFLFTVLFIAFLAALIAGAYYGLIYFGNMYLELDTAFRLVLLAVVVTILIASMIVARGARVAARMIANGRLSEARHELYAQVLSMYRSLVDSSATLERSGCEKILAELQKVEPNFLLLASGAAYHAHIQLQTALQRGENCDRLLELFTQLVKCFRHDLGHVGTYDEFKFDGARAPSNDGNLQNEHLGIQKA